MLLVTLWAEPAAAFVCARASSDTNGVPSGPSLSWAARRVPYTLNQAGTASIPFAQLRTVLRSAFDVWQTLQLAPAMVAQCGALPGTDLSFYETASTSAATWIGYNFLNPNDNVNLLIFRDAVWPNAADSGDIIALTTTTFSALSGEIIDADIEFNSANFTFVGGLPNGTETDLLNTAVHEIGHFLGLAHCGSGACGNEEVMEPTASRGDISKRQLKCDDRAGIVFKYPAGRANGYCAATPAPECANCAPPQQTSVRPSVSLASTATGRPGLGCAAQAGGSPAALCGAVAALVARGRSPRRRLGRALLLVALGLLGACQSSECGGLGPTNSAHAPMILQMRLSQQVENDPWRLILATDFVSYDGTVGGGHAELFANHAATPSSTPPLGPLLQSSGGVSTRAMAGTFALPLRIAETTQDGAKLHLATQLVDSLGNRSNCYVVELNFSLLGR